VKHVKNDHEDYLLYEWRNIKPIPALLLIPGMDVDPPLPECLFDDPSWQLEINGYRPNLQEWTVDKELDDDGNITRIALTYKGIEIPQFLQKTHFISIRIRKPSSPGQYFAVRAGATHDYLKRDCLREEPPDEIECPNCEAELYPVPDKCPQCGETLDPDTPTVGELVDKYGRDARVEVYVSGMSADLIVNFTRTKKQADEINKKKRAAHDEKTASFKTRIAAWNDHLAPEKAQKKRDQEARERAELEKLKAKYESNTTG